MTRWQTGSPEIPEKTIRTFLVTILTDSGKHISTTAEFANNAWLEWSDDSYIPEDESEDGKLWNGWMEIKYSTSDDETYVQLKSNVIAWAPMPPPFTPGQQTIDQDFSLALFKASDAHKTAVMQKPTVTRGDGIEWSQRECFWMSMAAQDGFCAGARWMREQWLPLTLGHITETKASTILLKQGWSATGVVLCDTTRGTRAIVDTGCVRWMDNHEFQALIHPVFSDPPKP